jgi:MEDS: MEthanogen/methylotroph, DcmR Sensory domain
VIEERVTDAVDTGGCPHLAVILRREEDLPGVLANFYALGAKRNGWCVHRPLPGDEETDCERLREAGLDVDGLEADGRFAVAAMDPTLTPQQYTDTWTKALDDALAAGRTGLWYSRAVAKGIRGWDIIITYDRAWDEAFAGRPVVCLCPFVVGELPGEVSEAVDELATLHDGVLSPSGDEDFELVERSA